MPRRPPYDPSTEMRALSVALRKAAKTAGRSLGSLSVEMGFYPLYLTRALAGHARLRVDVGFAVLGKLDVVPQVFFADLFPLGGPAYAELRRRVAGREGGKGEAGGVRELVRAEARRRGLLSAREVELRAGELLRLFLRRAGQSQKAAAASLGLSAGALGQVLRGTARLTFRHIFGVLRFLGVPPGRFFRELLLPRPTEPGGSELQAEVLDVVSRLLEDTSRGLLAKEREAKARAPKRNPATQEED